ncbi:MAG: 16S rRNA (uracil(1498)-N(3))-methyltransferase [Moraxellaceae bacterium]|nr:16S rRNA (uracil(1498)-N(3))-methyltransferase [Moraxellaceae bacterium]
MNCILLEKNNPNITNPQQIEHISKILKLNIGDSLTVGEINGNIGTAKIKQIFTDKIALTDINLTRPPPSKLGVTVVLALPRPKVLRRLIMDMTALGADKIILINSYCTQKSYWQSPLLNRLDEFIFEGLQQTVDTVAPVIELKERFKPFVEDEFSELVGEGNAVVAHPYAEQSWQDYLTNNHQPSVLCIGAEGGWITYEVDLLQSYGAKAVSLGQRILRTESAVNVILGGLFN